jgi:hypothetical protein
VNNFRSDGAQQTDTLLNYNMHLSSCAFLESNIITHCVIAVGHNLFHSQNSCITNK